MRKIEMIPFVGVDDTACGKLRFGMSKEEVEQLLGEGNYSTETAFFPGAPAARGCYADPRPYTAYCQYRVYFSEADKAVEITLFPALPEDDTEISLCGVSLFRHKAEAVIAELEKQAACTWDGQDKDLGTQYDFDALAFSLWRSSAFHQKLFDDAAYMQEYREMLPENQEEELKYQYFQASSLYTRELYTAQQTWIASLQLPR